MLGDDTRHTIVADNGGLRHAVLGIFDFVYRHIALVLELEMGTATTAVEPVVDVIDIVEVRRCAVGILAFLGVFTMRGKEAQMLHILDFQQLTVVERHTEIVEKAVEEVEHVETDTGLRTVGIEHPVREMKLRAGGNLLLIDLRSCLLAVVLQPVVGVTDASVAILRLGVGVTDIDVACLHLRHHTLMAVGIAQRLFQYGYILGARRLTFGRVGEAEGLRGIFHVAGLRIRTALIVVRLLTVKGDLHMVVVCRFGGHGTNLLTNENLVFQGTF